jgi:hypothetical protein
MVQVTSHGAESSKTGTGAGAVQIITNLSWQQEQIAKMCAKQMTFIVRVRLRF